MRFAAIALLIAAGLPAGAQAPVVRMAAEGFVTADDGIRLHYRIEGAGSQTVVIPAEAYLHRDLSALARGRRVVFYDMRGRGRSDRVSDSTHITIQWDVRDLEAIRRAVGAERIAVVGWSYLGLMVAMYAADHPTRVERVVQIGPVARRWDTRFPAEWTANDPVPVIDSATRARADRIARAAMSEGDSEAACQSIHQLTRVGLVGDARLAERVPNVCELPNEWPAAFSRHLRHHFVGSVQSLDIPWQTFQALTMPLLTIHGTKDRNAPFGAGREWVSRLPNARLLAIEGAAHMPWIDQPNTVVTSMDLFLRGEWPPAAVRLPASPPVIR